MVQSLTPLLTVYYPIFKLTLSKQKFANFRILIMDYNMSVCRSE